RGLPGRHAIEWRVELDGAELRGIMAERILLANILGIERSAPVRIMPARRADPQFATTVPGHGRAFAIFPAAFIIRAPLCPMAERGNSELVAESDFRPMSLPSR